MNESLIKKFASSAGFVLVARLMAFVAMFGFNALLARALSPQEFGVFVLLLSLLVLISLFSNGGLNIAVVKLISESHDSKAVTTGSAEINSAATHSVATTKLLSKLILVVLVLSLALATLAYFLAAHWLTGVLPSNANSIALLFAVCALLRSLHLILAESARGFHDRIWSNLFGGIAGGPLPHFLFLVFLGVAYWDGDLNLEKALGCYLLAFLVTLPVVALKLFQLNRKHVALGGQDVTAETGRGCVGPGNSALLALAIPLLMTQVLGVGIAQTDIWLAGALVAPGALAVYAVAQRMLAFLTVPLQITNTAIIADVPQLFKQRKMLQLQKLVSLAANVSALPAMIVGAILLAFPETILSFAFGQYYGSGALFLMILVIGQLICVATGPCQVVLVMTGHEKTAMLVNFFTAIFAIMSGLVGVCYFSMAGLAAAVSLTIVLQNVCNWWIVKKRVGIDTRCGLNLSELSMFFNLLKLKKAY